MFPQYAVISLRPSYPESLEVEFDQLKFCFCFINEITIKCWKLNCYKLFDDLFHQAHSGKYVRSGCTTALNVVPWETDGESVLREAMTNTQTPPHATTVVIPTGAPATNTVANHAERPEKFNGQNFKRWQQKMFFYLTTLGLARFLKETVPQVEPPAEGQSSNAQAVQAVEAWKHSDFLCHNYVLNGLIDPLYNVYCKTTTAKELWESLERKYKTEDAGTKKFVVARFLDYKMVDSKNVISQVQDLQVLLHDIHAEGMTLSETFQVAAIIEKLPPSWVEFKNYLKHKRKEMSVEDLVVRLRIEEDNKLAQKDTYAPDSAKANMVEHAGSSLRSNPKGKGKDKRKNDKKSKGKSEYLAPKAGIVKQKFQGTCYNCDQPGHRAANCKMPKRVNPRQANMVDENVDMIAMVSDVCAMISEVNLVGTNNSGWWIDTGATRHVCADKSMFHSFRAVDNGQKLYMGNSATADIKGEGDVILKMTSEKELKLTNVLYVPEIRKNLVSGWLLNKFGFRLVFESDKFVLSKNQMYVGRGYAMNGMFKLNVMVVKNEINKMNSSAYLIESSNVWHGRLGHVNFNSMRRLIKFNSIPNCHIDSKYKCETCVEAKLTRTPFKSVKRTTEPLDMIHTDICDLKSLPTKGGNKYFITFIDDCTKYCYVYLLKSKDEAIDKFVLYKTEVENQLGKKIKVVRSDRGGEYVAPFAELCAKHGIRHEFTAPYSPQQNGIAERKNRTLKEMVTAMLISSGMSQDILSSPRSPISSRSSVSHLSPTSQTSPESSNGQPSLVSTTSIPTPPPPTPPPLITQQRLANLRQNPKQQVPYNPSANHATVTTITEPTSFTVAYNSPEWHQAMKEEYDALIKNGTWSLVPRASNTNVVDGKWVYRLKRDKNGAITCYKARFVAKVFRQQPGIDFHETVSLVVKSTTIRAVLSLAVTNNWPLRQLDVHNAFLHGNLKEQVYMKQPLGFIDPQRPNHVCLLHKSLYGLKQAPRAWFELLSKALFNLGFKGSKTDPSLFIYSRGHILLYILVYVDDIIITGNNKGTIDNIISQLGSDFALKDLGPLNYFLGIEIVPHVSSILLSQKKYILELLQSAGLSNCNHVYVSSTLQAFTDVLWKEVEYKALDDTVAELIWLQALLHELGISSSSTPILWCDNLGATYLSANPIFRARTKHVEIDYNFVREKIAQGDIRFQHISTHDQIADIFTKSLPTPRFIFLRSKLQVVAFP
ncbi:retrovirus-related pol polyprotein from transposon TNT 1-94 [Tanacetum coccineum]